MLGVDDDLDSFFGSSSQEDSPKASASSLVKCTKVFFTGSSSFSRKSSMHSLRSAVLARDPSCFSHVSVVEASERHTDWFEGDGVLEGSLNGTSLVDARPRTFFFSSTNPDLTLPVPLTEFAIASLAKKTGIMATNGEPPLALPELWHGAQLPIMGVKGFAVFERGVLATMVSKILFL
jgi:hypothetical protein